jgi:hypothetical protein
MSEGQKDGHKDERVQSKKDRSELATEKQKSRKSLFLFDPRTLDDE